MRLHVSWLVLAAQALAVGALQAVAPPAAEAAVVVSSGQRHVRPVPGPVWVGTPGRAWVGPRWGVRRPVRPGCCWGPGWSWHPGWTSGWAWGTRWGWGWGPGWGVGWSVAPAWGWAAPASVWIQPSWVPLETAVVASPFADPPQAAGAAQPEWAPPQDQPAPQAVPQRQGQWYYCTEPAGYYPYVQSCSRPWIAVQPNQP